MHVVGKQRGVAETDSAGMVVPDSLQKRRANRLEQSRVDCDAHEHFYGANDGAFVKGGQEV